MNISVSELPKAERCFIFVTFDRYQQCKWTVSHYQHFKVCNVCLHAKHSQTHESYRWHTCSWPLQAECCTLNSFSTIKMKSFQFYDFYEIKAQESVVNLRRTKTLGIRFGFASTNKFYIFSNKIVSWIKFEMSLMFVNERNGKYFNFQYLFQLRELQC